MRYYKHCHVVTMEGLLIVHEDVCICVPFGETKQDFINRYILLSIAFYNTMDVDVRFLLVTQVLDTRACNNMYSN